MKKKLKSGILSADHRPTVGGAYVIAVLHMHLQQATFMPLSCTYMYSYTVITHVHFVDLDILTNLKFF